MHQETNKPTEKELKKIADNLKKDWRESEELVDKILPDEEYAKILKRQMNKITDGGIIGKIGTIILVLIIIFVLLALIKWSFSILL